MSQFCGSFCALSNRSLLTVILYCASSGETASAAIETPAKAAQAKRIRVQACCCMIASLKGASCRGAPFANGTLSANVRLDNCRGAQERSARSVDLLDDVDDLWRRSVKAPDELLQLAATDRINL